MWVDDSAVCDPEAADYLVERFDAFDPDDWHGWAELADARAIGAQRLSRTPRASPANRYSWRRGSWSTSASGAYSTSSRCAP